MEQDTQTQTEESHSPIYRIDPTQPIMAPPRAGIASAGLAQTFGLDVRAAVLVILVDLMLFSVDVMSAGAFIIMGLLVAAALGYIVYQIQRAWFGDDDQSAMIKALIVALLTAIPVPLTPLIAVPTGMLGLWRLVTRKNAN